MLNFVKRFFCIHWHDHVFSTYSTRRVYYINWFLSVQPTLLSWDTSHLIMVYNPLICCEFSLLVLRIFVYIHKRYYSVVFISFGAFVWFRYTGLIEWVGNFYMLAFLILFSDFKGYLYILIFSLFLLDFYMSLFEPNWHLLKGKISDAP